MSVGVNSLHNTGMHHCEPWTEEQWFNNCTQDSNNGAREAGAWIGTIGKPFHR